MPAVANMIVKHPQVDQFVLSFVRAITLRSAPPSLFVMQEFKRRWGIDIGNIWGQNEGTGIVCGPRDIPDMGKRVDHFPQFGKPGIKWYSKIASDYTKTKLVCPDPGKQVTEVGQIGELTVGGPMVIPGYFKCPHLTEKSFDEEGYFYTEELFQIKEGNCIGFFERKKDIIIRGGFNISAQEIENTLLSHSKVADVAAVAMLDEKLGEQVFVWTRGRFSCPFFLLAEKFLLFRPQAS